MNISRRQLLKNGITAGCTALLSPVFESFVPPRTQRSDSTTPATYSVTPVIGDGVNVLSDPPDDVSGYFNSREFEVSIGMTFTGRGDGTDLFGATATPVSLPEQQVLDLEIQKQQCEAEIVPLSDTAAQFALYAPCIRDGQVISATAKYRLQVSMDYRGFSRDRFPETQHNAREVFGREFLGNTPGINCNDTTVKDIVREMTSRGMHPWDAANEFHEWVFGNIEGFPGEYTGVEQAIRNGRGDCEERAAVFIAFCRAAGIPARLVWVPGHNWAEFGLIDHDGQPHWIPAHTAAYSWFGWTGVHEIVLQKGGNVLPWRRRRRIRLIDDWWQINGARPQVSYTALIKPLPGEAEDAWPGQREKMEGGVWELTGSHPDQAVLRDK